MKIMNGLRRDLEGRDNDVWMKVLCPTVFYFVCLQGSTRIIGQHGPIILNHNEVHEENVQFMYAVSTADQMPFKSSGQTDDQDLHFARACAQYANSEDVLRYQQHLLHTSKLPVINGWKI